MRFTLALGGLGIVLLLVGGAAIALAGEWSGILRELVSSRPSRGSP